MGSNAVKTRPLPTLGEPLTLAGVPFTAVPSFRQKAESLYLCIVQSLNVGLWGRRHEQRRGDSLQQKTIPELSNNNLLSKKVTNLSVLRRKEGVLCVWNSKAGHEGPLVMLLRSTFLV